MKRLRWLPWKQEGNTEDLVIEDPNKEDPDRFYGFVQVGMACIWLDDGIIFHFVINRPYRRRGLGTRLLRKAEDRLLYFGFDKSQVLVNRHDKETAKFYLKHGYHKTKKIIISCHIYAKKLRKKHRKVY